MMRSLTDIQGYAIAAKDGKMGKVHDIYFDDTEWRVRYFVADTGAWLPGRKVLISPLSAERADGEKRILSVNLTTAQVAGSPPVSTDEPMSRQKEALLMEYFGWPSYWPSSPVLVRGTPTGSEEEKLASAIRPTGTSITVEGGDSHLRSAREVVGHHIEANDGQIGHVMDFIADDGTWDIRYLVVDTRNWFVGGKKVLIAPGWVERVDWKTSVVRVGLTKDRIKDSPEYDPEALVNREYETRLYDYYGRPRYWE